ncbi:hypothetical protein DOTSEDRAFT_80278 [Dothistroma septosporum NZE10]|uniref:F-box domain-containing protein n=1 Tax=Dothistroma septosporum (strain NZE10 / CBS 128990) TaxID=675120 RepID=N1PQC7_DOTSN|nr:hypothetical protein DOTSEDRAFT_80278 [Dothistroma septosporum NZE10]
MLRENSVLQGAMTRPTLTNHHQRLHPQLPDEITLNVLGNASAMTLLALRHTSRRLRRTVDGESPRLCRILRESEDARIEAMWRPLELKGVSMEQALRVRVKRWGKPVQGRYWRACMSLAGEYGAANPHMCRHVFQDSLFEFLLHFDDSCHEQLPEVVEDGSERIKKRCCWSEYRAVELSQGELTTEMASELLYLFRGRRDKAAPPPIEERGLIGMIASVRSHRLEHDRTSVAEKARLHAQWRNVVVHGAKSCSTASRGGTELQLPMIWSPFCWLPKADRSSDGGSIVRQSKAVAITKWLLHRAQMSSCWSECDEHVSIMRVALLQELDVFRPEDAQHMQLSVRTRSGNEIMILVSAEAHLRVPVMSTSLLIAPTTSKPCLLARTGSVSANTGPIGPLDGTGAHDAGVVLMPTAKRPTEPI